MTRRRLTWPAAALVVAALAACGSSGGTGQATTTASSASTSPPGPSTTLAGATTTAGSATTPASTTAPKSRDQVGQVTDIVPSGGRADGQRVDDGTPLLRGTVLSTEPAGSVYFTTGGKLRRCNVRPGSSVRLAPEGEVLLEFLSGKTWCETTSDDAVVTFKAGGQTLRAADPVFSVQVADDGRVELQVAQGYVLAGEGDSAVVVGEGQRAGLGEGSNPELGPFGLDELASGGSDPERTVAGDMRTQVTSQRKVAQLRRTDVQRSPTLRSRPPSTSTSSPTDPTAPATTGTTPTALEPKLRVLVDEAGGDAAVSLAGDLLAKLLARSGVEVAAAGASASDAAAALEAGEAGAFVTTGKAPGVSVPLFQDDDGQVWKVWIAADDAELRASLEAGLRAVLETSCGDGSGSLERRGEGEASCYESLYYRAYSSIPVPLTPFASILGLR